MPNAKISVLFSMSVVLIQSNLWQVLKPLAHMRLIELALAAIGIIGITSSPGMVQARDKYQSWQQQIQVSAIALAKLGEGAFSHITIRGQLANLSLTIAHISSNKLMLIPLRKAVQELGLHPNTLRKYADEGKIKSIKNEAGQRLFDVQSYVGNATRTSLVCYCRVSSTKQRDDLDRQVAYMPIQFS